MDRGAWQVDHGTAESDMTGDWVLAVYLDRIESCAATAADLQQP